MSSQDKSNGPSWEETLAQGAVIPACPLALTSRRTLDDSHQRALVRYYVAAGARGLAVGVHTTQFAIHDPRVGLYKPVLTLASQAIDEVSAPGFIKVAGLVGDTHQAIREAEWALEMGYHCGLLSLSSMRRATLDETLAHCLEVARVIPLFGFYLQPAVGGRVLPYGFWRQFAEIPNVKAIKIAPFNRYHTLDVIRGVAEAGRAGEIALYTGNDDNILVDLLTDYPLPGSDQRVRIVGGLLGHWAVWTERAVAQLQACRDAAGQPHVSGELLRLAPEVTDCNAAFFDAANGFAGCIAGIHEILRRQGLLAGRWCLDPDEDLSPGQMEEIDRVHASYPHLHDDAFVAERISEWM